MKLAQGLLAIVAVALAVPVHAAFHLFRIDQDFLMVRDGAQMTRALRDLKNDPELRASLVHNGLETIMKRHTCAHRVDELMAIAERLRMSSLETAA